MEPVFRPFTGRLQEEETQQPQAQPELRPFQGTLRGAPPQDQSRAPFRGQATPPEFQPQQQPQGPSPAPLDLSVPDTTQPLTQRPPETPTRSGPVDLPPPSMSMYNDLGRGDAAVQRARERYEMYANHPEATRGVMGEVLYKNRVVPKPFSGLFKDPDPSFVTSVRGIARNTVQNLTETAGAVGDFIADRANIGGVQVVDPDTGSFRPRIVSPEERRERGGLFSRIARDTAVLDPGEGIIDNITIEGGQLIGGGLGGLKVASALVKNLPKASNNRFVSGLAKLLGFEIGAASALSDDVQTLLIGSNAMLSGAQEYAPFLKGVTVDPESPEYAQILQKRANILMDATALAKPAEGAVKAAAWTLGTVWSVSAAPFLNAFRKGSKEEAIVNDILNQLALVGSRDDAASIEAKKAITDLIRNNQDVFIKIGEDFGPDIRMTVDTMTALERALRDNNTELAQQLTAKLRGLRTGVMNQGGGAPALTTKLGEPQRQFEGTTRQVEEVLGGEQAIEASRQGLVRSGQADVAAARGLADDIDLRIADAERNLDYLIRNDPTFGNKLDELSRKSGVMVYSSPSQTMDEIVGNVRQAYENMTATKNNLYSGIVGGEVDPASVLQILNKLQPGQLDAAAGALPANSQFGAMLSAARRQTVQEADSAGNMVARQETDEELAERFARWVDSNDLDFAKLYRDIRPSVSQSAENLFNSTAPEARAAGQTLREFTNWIDNDAVDFLIRSGDDAVAEAAQAAKDYYMRDYAPFWRDGALREVADLHRQTVGRTSDAMAREGMQIRPVDFQSGARQTLESSLTDANRERAAQVVRLLDRPEAGQNAPLVTDYVIGRAVDTIDDALSVGGRLSDMDMAPLVRELRSYSDVVAQNFPEQAQRINQFIDNIAQSRGNIEALRGQLDEARQIAKQAEDTLYSQELSRFFRGVGIENPDGYNVFAQLLSNPQSADDIAALVARAEAAGDPVVLEGMQAAYARFLRNQFLGTTTEIGGNRAMRTGNLVQETEGLRNVLEYGDTIFKDRPEFMESVRELLDISGLISRSKSAKSVATDSATAARLEATRASNQMITMVFGVLNRIGARLRSGATTLINKVAPDEAGMRMLDAIMSDPEYFLRVADRAIKKQTPMDEEIRDAIFSFLVRGGIYNQEDRGEFLPAMAQIEMEMRNAREQAGEDMDSFMRSISP